jgi:SAM-dependent methyltransferase
VAHISPDAPSVLRSSRLRTLIRIWLLEPTMRKLPRRGRMLDLCCGYGFYLRMNPQASGIDGDPACVEALCTQGRDVKLANVLERFPYDDGAFDYVLAHDVLEHFVFEELETLVAEDHRELAPDGTLRGLGAEPQGVQRRARPCGGPSPLRHRVRDGEARRRTVHDRGAPCRAVAASTRASVHAQQGSLHPPQVLIAGAVAASERAAGHPP